MAMAVADFIYAALCTFPECGTQEFLFRDFDGYLCNLIPLGLFKGAEGSGRVWLYASFVFRSLEFSREGFQDD